MQWSSFQMRLHSEVLGVRASMDDFGDGDWNINHTTYFIGLLWKFSKIMYKNILLNVWHIILNKLSDNNGFETFCLYKMLQLIFAAYDLHFCLSVYLTRTLTHSLLIHSSCSQMFLCFLFVLSTVGIIMLCFFTCLC